MKVSILVDENQVVTAYGVCLSDTHKPFSSGVVMETDVDLETLIGNYRLNDDTLVEIPEGERVSILPQPTRDERLEVLEAAMLEVILGG